MISRILSMASVKYLFDYPLLILQRKTQFFKGYIFAITKLLAKDENK